MVVFWYKPLLPAVSHLLLPSPSLRLWWQSFFLLTREPCIPTGGACTGLCSLSSLPPLSYQNAFHQAWSTCPKLGTPWVHSVPQVIFTTPGLPPPPGQLGQTWGALLSKDLENQAKGNYSSLNIRLIVPSSMERCHNPSISDTFVVSQTGAQLGNSLNV